MDSLSSIHVHDGRLFQELQVIKELGRSDRAPQQAEDSARIHMERDDPEQDVAPARKYGH